MVKSGPVTRRGSTIAGLRCFGLLVFPSVERMKRRQMLRKCVGIRTCSNGQ